MRFTLHDRHAGFTVVEVLMSLFIVSAVLTTAINITNASNQTNARTKQYAEANSLVFGKIQDYETRDFSAIPVGTLANNYEVEDWSAEVTTKSGGIVKDPVAKVYSEPEPGSGSLLKVRVVLDFQYGGNTRRIEYATYIQLGGVGR